MLCHGDTTCAPLARGDICKSYVTLKQHEPFDDTYNDQCKSAGLDSSVLSTAQQGLFGEKKTMNNIMLLAVAWIIDKYLV